MKAALIMVAVLEASVSSMFVAASRPGSQPAPCRWCGDWGCPCIAPRWEPTYDMARSTIIQPCNESGLLDPEFMSKFGVVSLDWSNAKALWANQSPMASDKLMVEQAQDIRRLNNDTRVWVYRNLVKALPWFSAVRQKLADPAYSGWFLQVDPTVEPHMPPCDHDYSPPRCSKLYHDQLETPQHSAPPPPSWPPASQCNRPCDCGEGVPCGEYLFDHRNASLRKWLVDEYIGGSEGIGNPDVSGM